MSREKAAGDQARREELFSKSSGESNVRQRSSEIRAQDVTASLMELRGTLHTQVQSSTDTLQNLVSSSTQLSKTKTEMDGIGAKVKVSGGLISKYERRELTDRVLITAALVLFFGVVLYIIQKRLFGWLWWW